jgi:hypothetical protein
MAKIKPFSIDVVRMLSPKCPRCYDRNGVEENFMGMCDRCCTICLDAADDYVELNILTQDESDRLVNGIKEARQLQLTKYGKT